MYPSNPNPSTGAPMYPVAGPNHPIYPSDPHDSMPLQQPSFGFGGLNNHPQPGFGQAPSNTEDVEKRVKSPKRPGTSSRKNRIIDEDTRESVCFSIIYVISLK